MKRILIVYATAGVGHAKAAMAVKKALEELKPDAEIFLMDSLEYVTGFFRISYLRTYLLLVNRFSDCWGFFYHLINNFYVNILISKIRRYANWLNSRRLAEFLLEFKPDVVVSTHFLASEVISNLKKKGLLKTHLINVLTDYRLHAFWIAPNIDTYVVATEDTKRDLLSWKIEPSKIWVTGIPVAPEFSRTHEDKPALQKRLGLKQGLFTILVVGGGFGMGPMESIVKVLDELGHPVQVMAVCGYNQKLRQRIRTLKNRVQVEVHDLGFVENMHELMEVSDILISKSGGVTVTEALAEKLPMIVVSPIPGQETRNSLFLVRHGAAIQVTGLVHLRAILKLICDDRRQIDRMKENIERIRRPYAAFEIAKFALDVNK